MEVEHTVGGVDGVLHQGDGRELFGDHVVDVCLGLG